MLAFVKKILDRSKTAADVAAEQAVPYRRRVEVEAQIAEADATAHELRTRRVLGEHVSADEIEKAEAAADDARRELAAIDAAVRSLTPAVVEAGAKELPARIAEARKQLEALHAPRQAALARIAAAFFAIQRELLALGVAVPDQRGRFALEAVRNQLRIPYALEDAFMEAALAEAEKIPTWKPADNPQAALAARLGKLANSGISTLVAEAMDAVGINGAIKTEALKLAEAQDHPAAVPAQEEPEAIYAFNIEDDGGRTMDTVTVGAGGIEAARALAFQKAKQGDFARVREMWKRPTGPLRNGPYVATYKAGTILAFTEEPAPQ